MGHLDLIKTWRKLNELVDTKTNLKIEINNEEFVLYDNVHIHLKTNSVHNLYNFVLGYTSNKNIYKND